jgi:hypothetical protein
MLCFHFSVPKFSPNMYAFFLNSLERETNFIEKLKNANLPKKQSSYGGQMKNAHYKFYRGIKMKYISVWENKIKYLRTYSSITKIPSSFKVKKMLSLAASCCQRAIFTHNTLRPQGTLNGI